MNYQTVGPTPATAIFRVLFRHWKRAFAVFCFFMLLAVGWIFVMPTTYESEAKVYVRVGRENITLDPTATTGETVQIYQTLESEINSMLQILKSRETASNVIAEVGVDSILANHTVGGDGGSQSASRTNVLDNLKGWLGDVKESIFSSLPETPESQATRKLFAQTSFTIPKDSNVIVINCKSGDPHLSQSIAKAWTNAFLKEHLRLTRTEGSYDFFVEQADELRGQLEDVENRLTLLKSSSNLVSVEGQKQILETQMGGIRSRLLANQSRLQSSEAKVSELKKIVVDLPERVATDQITGLTHEAWNRMRENLFALQIQEQQMKARYKPTHPDVVAVESQRKEVEQILESQSDSSAQATSSPNPTRQIIEQAMLTEDALVVALQAEKKMIEHQRDELSAEIQKLNENALEINQLERQRQIMENTYRAHIEKMEQARVLASLENERISSVNVLQPASFVADPAGPGRLMCLMVGFVLGSVCAAGIAFLSEYFDRSFVTAAEVEQTLGLPVVASIPQSLRPFRVG